MSGMLTIRRGETEYLRPSTAVGKAPQATHPVENVIGRVGIFSLDAGGNGTPPVIRYGRIGTAVQ